MAPAAPASAAELARRESWLERLLPARERSDALWIAGVAAGIGTLRAFVYAPLQQVVIGASGLLSGSASSVWAIDAAWGLVCAVIFWALLRYAPAPRATALYVALSGVTVAMIVMGDRLALGAIMALAEPGSGRQQLAGALQPAGLALTEAAGVVTGAWLAQLTSAAEPDASAGRSLASAVGWQGGHATGAAFLAISWIVARIVKQLASTIIQLLPNAYSIWSMSRGRGFGSGQWSSLAGELGVIIVYFLVGYLGVKRFSAPRSVWLPFAAAGVPVMVSAILFLPQQYAALGQVSPQMLFLGLFSLVAWPLGELPPILGVWFATRPARVTESSATLRT